MMGFQEKELRQHIAMLFNHYGENTDYFEEYVQDVLKYPISVALRCFRDLVSQINVKPKEKAANVERLQGMPNKSTKYKKQGKL